MMQVSPNSRNTIPGKVFLTIDLRHPDDHTLSAMEAELRKACAEICEPARIAADIEMIWYSPPIVFDRDCVGAVKQAAATAGYENMEIRSEERRVGKEGVSTCRSRWLPSHYKKKKKNKQN